MSMIYAGPECQHCHRPLCRPGERSAEHRLCLECQAVEKGAAEADSATLAQYLRAMAKSDHLYGLFGYQTAIREAAKRLTPDT